MTGAITFNTNDLQNYSAATRTGIITDKILHNDIPDKDVALMALANANGSVIPQSQYPSKKITISGTIKGSSDIDIDSRIDAFKAYFNGKDKNLDIVYAGTTRRYIATANAVAVERQNTGYFARFNVTFVCTNPFGRATALTTALNAAGRTLAGYTDSHTFVGSAPCLQPIITITLTAVSGGASFISWGNNTNGQGITITDQTWVSGDVLEIDTRTGYKTVKKNGVEIDFLGAFPEFAPGSQSFSYADGFTSRTMTELVQYYPEYL